MWKRKHSTALSLIVCFGVLGIIFASLFVMPFIVEGYLSSWRGFEGSDIERIGRVILISYYPGAVLGMVALGALIKMLFNIKNDMPFISSNVNCLRIISWCCFIVSAICLFGASTYYSFIFISVAAGFVGLILRVVKNVLQSAVELKSENDLTI